jgi:hypothetical protein
MLDALQKSAVFFWVQSGNVEYHENGYDLSLLLDLGALDINERISAGTVKNIILTEDKNTEFLEAILISSGFNKSDFTTISYFGCTQNHYLRPLINFIRNTIPKTTVIVHRDRDYNTDEEITEWEEQVKNLQAVPFSTDGVDVESHFLNPDHLQEISENLDSNLAKNLLDEIIREAKEDLIEKAINGRVDIEKKKGNSGKIDLGKLQKDIRQAYDEQREKYLHGKMILRKLRSAYREQYHCNLNILQTTEHISIPKLQKISQE